MTTIQALGNLSPNQSAAYELSSLGSTSYFEELHCAICEELYNFSSNAPLKLPCGHHVCSKEVEKFTQRATFRCPICNVIHQSTCQFKMNIGLLQIMNDISETLLCKTHQVRNSIVCLFDRAILCDDCLNDNEEHISHKRESLKIFMEKQKECRRWREDMENNLELKKIDFVRILESRQEKLLSELNDYILSKNYAQDKAEEVSSKLKTEIKAFFGELIAVANPENIIKKCDFALQTPFLETKIKQDLEFGIYQLEIDDMRNEFKKWFHKINTDNVLRGVEQRVGEIHLDFDCGDSIKFITQSSIKKLEYKKLIAGEYDLLGGILSGITGIMYLKKRKHENAIESFKKAVSLTKVYFDKIHPVVSRAYYGLGAAFSLVGNSDKTIKYQSRAIDGYKKIYGDDFLDIGDCYVALGNAYRSEGKYELALENFWSAITIKKKSCDGNVVVMVPIYNNIGNIFRLQSKYSEAFDMHDLAKKIAEKVHGPFHPIVGDCLDDMGVCQTYLLDVEKALDCLLKALEIRRKHFGDVHPSIANSYNNLGLVYKVDGRLEEALENYKLSLKIRTATLGDNNSSAATVYNNMGVIYRTLGKFDESINCHKKALEIRTKVFGESHFEVAKTFSALGKAYKSKGDNQLATDYFKQAIEMMRKFVEDDHPEVQKILKILKSK